MATTSAQTSTMASDHRNTWMLIQKPFSSDRHTSALNSTSRRKYTSPSTPSRTVNSTAMKSTKYTARPMPIEYQHQSRARSPSMRASSRRPSLARRPARNEKTTAGIPVGGNSSEAIDAAR